jgi:hypothetical protein
MANKHMLDIALDMFAATFNKKDEWKAQVLPVWDAGLERVKDVHLHKAILNVCMKKHKYPPTLGHVLEEVKEVIRELGGTGMELKEYKFCDDCVQREGIREISAHFIILADKRFKIHNCVARCTCDGASMKYPQMGDWNSLYVKMQHDARITLKTWHMSDGKVPILFMKQREPHHYARMLRVQKERAHDGRKNIFADIAKTMIDGRYVPSDTNPMPMPKTIDKPTTTHYNTFHAETDIDPDDCIW